MEKIGTVEHFKGRFQLYKTSDIMKYFPFPLVLIERVKEKFSKPLFVEMDTDGVWVEEDKFIPDGCGGDVFLFN